MSVRVNSINYQQSANKKNDSSTFSFEDILNKVRSSYGDERAQNFDVKNNEQIINQAKLLDLQLYEQRQFLNLQKTWAEHIKWQLWSVIAFQVLFVMLVGFNFYDFTDNILKLQNFYFAVIFQSLANIVAIGLVVAKFLFPDGKFKADKSKNNSS